MRHTARLLALLVLLAPGLARSQTPPRVIGSASEIGSWDEAQAVPLADDGTGGDAVAADGVFTARVTLQPGAVVDYKIIPPNETLGGGQAIGQSPDGAVVPDMRIDLAGENAPVTVEFRYSDNSGTDWLPVRSISDSWNTGWSADPSLRRVAGFIVVGGLQESFGAAAWDPDGALTALRDDGRGADAMASDGVATVAVATGVPPGPGGWKVAAPGASWTLKLGTDGWSFDPNDSANFAIDLAAWTPVRFELDLARGAARAVLAPELFAPLLLSEIVTGPTAAEFVEVHNPSPAVVSLDGVFLSDHPGYHLLPGTPTAPASSDFNAAFPLGAAIGPGGFQTVAFAGAPGFLAEYGVVPDYELVDSGSPVPDLLEAHGGSIGSSAGLTGTNEFVALYAWWSGDLVEDLDLVTWGTLSSANQPATKTDVAPVAGGPAYGPEAWTALTSVASGTAERYARRDYTEGTEQLSACTAPCPVDGSAAGVFNGVFDPAAVGRADESSEDLAATWGRSPAATPGAHNGFEYLVVGTVVDGAAAPVAGATVTAEYDGESLTAVTDAAGAFEFATLTHGTWSFTARLIGHRSDLRTATIQADTVLEPLVLEASTTQWTVSGTVSDGQGAPFTGATVSADGGGSATTGTDGRYALSLLEGAHTLTASADGYGADTAPITLTADLVQDFVLVAGAVTIQVSGVVRSAATSSGLAGATVVLDDGAGTSLDVTSGADGGFVFETVPGETTYTLSASVTGHLPASQEVVAGTEDVSGLVVDLSEAGETFPVSGTVITAADGTGIGGATVTLAALSLSTTTTAAGAFEFAAVPAGTWAMAADADGYVAAQVTITVANAEVTGVELALAADAVRVTLSGSVVRDDGGTPIPTAVVELTTPSGIRVEEVDDQGLYAIAGLEPGTYDAVAKAPGYQDSAVTLDLTSDTVHDFRLVARPSFTVTFSGVVQLSDQPAGSWGGTTVNVGSLGSAVTADDGTYRIMGLQRGEYTVTVTHAGYATHNMNLTLEEDTVQDFILTPRETGEPEAPGCGCAASGGSPGAGGWLLLLALASLGRVPRRRASRRCASARRASGQSR